jgi:hypothetical protein
MDWIFVDMPIRSRQDLNFFQKLLFQGENVVLFLAILSIFSNFLKFISRPDPFKRRPLSQQRILKDWAIPEHLRWVYNLYPLRLGRNASRFGCRKIGSIPHLFTSAITAMDYLPSLLQSFFSLCDRLCLYLLAGRSGGGGPIIRFKKAQKILGLLYIMVPCSMIFHRSTETS